MDARWPNECLLVTSTSGRCNVVKAFVKCKRDKDGLLTAVPTTPIRFSSPSDFDEGTGPATQTARSVRPEPRSDSRGKNISVIPSAPHLPILALSHVILGGIDSAVCFRISTRSLRVSTTLLSHDGADFGCSDHVALAEVCSSRAPPAQHRREATEVRELYHDTLSFLVHSNFTVTRTKEPLPAQQLFYCSSCLKFISVRHPAIITNEAGTLLVFICADLRQLRES